MDWQPIETAPADTWVLLAGGKPDWLLYQEELPVPSVVTALRVTARGKSWLIALTEAGYVGAYYDNPTHWMPLPPPPHTEASWTVGGDSGTTVYETPTHPSPDS